MDPVAHLMKCRKRELLAALYESSVAKPPVVLRNLNYRMISSLYFGRTLSRHFSPGLLEVKNDDSLPYDLLVNRKHRISVKEICYDFLPRRKKRGLGWTRPVPIQLKNTKNSVRLFQDEWDYLLVAMAGSEKYGMYLLSMGQVQRLLSTNGGYDGKGQVRLFVPSKSRCLYCIEEPRKSLFERHRGEIVAKPGGELDMAFQMGMDDLIDGCLKRVRRAG